MAKAPRKYDKHFHPLPGFKRDPDAMRRLADDREERGVKKKSKAAMKRLRAEGFSVDRFVGNIERLKEKGADRK